ncbi:MAG TPA: type II toxin-antitoxin system RelE/ParE family toxin [Verrucomicrobiae bacterium]|nr:type II toxin-antitoxin system RelE/ParE family toxin [Verrucomicrobiae bacterium]
MRRWDVFVELPAQQDIAQARSWLAERDPGAADLWFDSIYDTIGSLETFPERCPFAPESKSFNCEIREIFHGRRQHKYRILFTVNENEVHVLHVRHGARLVLGETKSPDE